MIICICGDIKYKNILLDEFKKIYKDRIVLCDYFKIKFDSIIESESIKYKIFDRSSNLNLARNIYSDYVDKLVNKKIYRFLNINKDKIILLISDNVLTNDINNTKFFYESDLKILLNFKDTIDNKCIYDKNEFDILINEDNINNVRKLVKI